MGDGMALELGNNGRFHYGFRTLWYRCIDKNHVIKSADEFGMINLQLMSRNEFDAGKCRILQLLDHKPANAIIPSAGIAVTQNQRLHFNHAPMFVALRHCYR